MIRLRRGRNQKGQLGLGNIGSILSGLVGGTGGGVSGALPQNAGGLGNVTGYAELLNNQQQSNQATTNLQSNQYNAGQQQLQSQLGAGYSGYLSGQIPQSFTAPQQVVDNFTHTYQNNVVPGLVAQYGAGSPQIAGQYGNALANLYSNLYQTGVANYGNALSGAAGYATTPMGQSQAGTGAANANTDQTVAGAQASGYGSLIPLILAALGLL